jgi:hypothetical protein
MTIRRFVVPVTTEYGGDAEAYSPVLSGKLVSIRYVKDDYADGVDFVLTAEDSGETLWSEEDVNASATRYPRAATHSTAGAAANYDGSSHAVLGKIALSQDRVKIVIADGGNETSGTFHITVDG